MMRERHDVIVLLFALAAVFIIAMLFLPVINLLFSAGFEGLIQAIRDKNAWKAIFVSFEAAFFATFLSFILGTPLAYLLARKRFPGKNLVESIIDLPIVIPHTVAGIALLLVLGRNGLIGASFNKFGMRLADSMAGIVAAMMFISAPFFINHAREGFESVDPRMENVAMSLGATRAKAMVTITFPLSLRNMFVGAIMTWARAISEVGAILIIAYYPKTAQVLVMEYFNNYGLRASRPISVILVLLSLSIFVVLRWFVGRSRNA